MCTSHPQERQCGEGASNKYNFNACYGHASTQEDIYSGSAEDIIQSSLKGFSGTIFYGPKNVASVYNEVVV